MSSDPDPGPCVLESGVVAHIRWTHGDINTHNNHQPATIYRHKQAGIVDRLPVELVLEAAGLLPPTVGPSFRNALHNGLHRRFEGCAC